MNRLTALFIALALAFALCQAADLDLPEPAPAIVPGKYLWRMDADFPRFDNEKVNRDIRRWLEQTAPSATDHLLGFAKTDMPEDRFEMDIEYNLTYAAPTIASVVFTIVYSPYKAAHPSTAASVLTYDLAAGKRLELGDFFADPEKALKIMEKHGKQLVREQAEIHADIVGYDDSIWFTEGFEAKEANYQTLGVEKDGVRIYFQQYQILPYAYGMPSPLVPLELLQPAGPNPAIWPADKR